MSAGELRRTPDSDASLAGGLALHGLLPTARLTGGFPEGNRR